MDVPSSIILEVLAIPDWFSPEVIETIQKATDYHNTGQYEKAYQSLCNIDADGAANSLEVESKVYLFIVCGSTRQSAGKYNDALSEFLSAKQLMDLKAQTNLLSYALVLSCIAGVEMHLSHFGKALSYLKKALRTRQQILGGDHADTALLLNNIAVCYTHMNLPESSFEEVMVLLNKAYKILHKELGVNHPRFATVMRNISKEKSRLTLRHTYTLRPLSPNVIKEK